MLARLAVPTILAVLGLGLSACAQPTPGDVDPADFDTVGLAEACTIVDCDCGPQGQLFVLDSERKPVQWDAQGLATCPQGMTLRRLDS
ncbi:MAG: hypothetical protein ACPGOY_12955 [Rhodospirillaceae bacterium]